MKPIYIYDISKNSSQNEKYFRQNCTQNQNRNISDKIVRKIKTNISDKIVRKIKT
jgi:hypothetical protein